MLMTVFRRTLFLFLFSTLAVSAQVTTYLKGIRPLSAPERSPLTVSVPLQQAGELSHVMLYYRSFGETEFRTQEMPLQRDSASVDLPASAVTAPFMEVYVIAFTRDGNMEAYPSENPEVNPARITITPASAELPNDVIILSPEEGEQIRAGETYISLSFVYADSTTDRTRTSVMLNGVDLSSSAVLYDDLLIVPSDAIPASAMTGSADLSVRTFDASGKTLSSVRRTFSVITDRQAEEMENEFQGYGSAQAESRNERIKGNGKTYNRLDARAAATYAKFLKMNAQLTVSSEEKPENQPQNRYALSVDARYVRLGLGDLYPRFPYTIMDGRRVRGFTGDLLLGFFNVNAARGELLRRVDINGVPAAWKRDMTIVRPSFGKGEKFQWGFSFMKAKDQFDILPTLPVKPQENVIFGTDLMWALDDRRIEWTMQTAVSLTNVDISATEFNADSIDAAVKRGTFSSSDGDQLKSLLPILRRFITPNENLTPINPAGGTSLVGETGLSFNYFGNFLKASYLYHGKDYSSAAATSLRKDIKGYSIMDRLRLFNNRLFLTGSVEKLTNNTAHTEITTTTYTTVNSAVSYYPVRDLPNITIGYGRSTNTNPLPSDTVGKNPVEQQIALRALNDRTNRFFVQAAYDFEYWGRHNASVNLDISEKKDNTIKRQDVSTTNLMLLGSTVHTPKLESTVGLSFSTLGFPQRDTARNMVQTTLSYQTLSLTGRYKLYEETWRLTATIAPTFGDLARLLLDASLQYVISQHQSAVLQGQFIANSASTVPAGVASRNDSFLSLLYRIDF